MSPRLRLLLILLIVVIVIAVGAVLVLPQLTGGGDDVGDTDTPATEVAQDPEDEDLPTPTPAATPIPTIDIIVAIQNINRGQVISPDLVDFRSWPVLYAPQSALTNPEDVIGQIARVDIFREQPILRSMVTENLSELGAVGSDAGALLPIGRRLIAVPIDRITSVGYAIRPGDRVDVIVSLLFVDVDPDFQTQLPNTLSILVVSQSEEGGLTLTWSDSEPGRIESVPVSGFPLSGLIGPWEERPRPRLATQMTVQDALVVHVGTFPLSGSLFEDSSETRVILPTPDPVDIGADTEVTDAEVDALESPSQVDLVEAEPDIVALAVSPQEAVVLTYFIESKMPITFALRPAAEVGTSNVEQVNLEYIMNTYRITLPRKLPYQVEPAVRSIRQLIAGETIELNQPIDETAEDGEGGNNEGNTANSNENNN